MIAHVPEEAFTSGILNKEYHDRLLVDIDGITDVAGIPPEYLWTRLSEVCQEADIEWVKSIKKHNDHGLALVNSGAKKGKPVTDRMMAITGACLRNYIDARVMPLQSVLAALKEDNMPMPSILLIPNFCLGNNDGGNIPAWQVSSLLGMLYSRLAKDLKTVVYIESLSGLEKSYGESFRHHIESHFSIA
jgi:hypothetical protein